MIVDNTSVAGGLPAGARMLCSANKNTTYPNGKPVSGHSSVIDDPIYAHAWTHMLTTPTAATTGGAGDVGVGVRGSDCVCPQT